MNPAPNPLRIRLVSQAFGNTWFATGWALFLCFMTAILWPLRNALLVCWVHGRDAYFRDGLRVLPGKPIRFTNGELVPDWPDFVTGAALFLTVTFSLTALLILLLRAYEHRY